MIIIDKKNTEQLLKVINMTEFLFIFFQLFSQWEHLKVSPRLNTRTGVQYWRWVQWSQKSHLLHFTTQHVYCFEAPLSASHDKNSIFLPLQCCLHRLFLATHPLTGAELVHLFYWFPTCLGLLFPWFFFQSFCWFAGFSGSTRYWYFFLLFCINGVQDVDVSLFG